MFDMTSHCVLYLPCPPWRETPCVTCFVVLVLCVVCFLGPSALYPSASAMLKRAFSKVSVHARFAPFSVLLER